MGADGPLDIIFFFLEQKFSDEERWDTRRENSVLQKIYRPLPNFLLAQKFLQKCARLSGRRRKVSSLEATHRTMICRHMYIMDTSTDKREKVGITSMIIFFFIWWDVTWASIISKFEVFLKSRVQRPVHFPALPWAWIWLKKRQDKMTRGSRKLYKKHSKMK